jgi:hypothetical protein
MATLRSFQQDIDEIHTREVAKQRAQASAAQLHVEKENKKPRIEKEKSAVKGDDSKADAWGKKAEGFDLNSGVEEDIIVSTNLKAQKVVLRICRLAVVINIWRTYKSRPGEGYPCGAAYPVSRRIYIQNRSSASSCTIIRWRIHRQ